MIPDRFPRDRLTITQRRVLVALEQAGDQGACSRHLRHPNCGDAGWTARVSELARKLAPYGVEIRRHTCCCARCLYANGRAQERGRVTRRRAYRLADREERSDGDE